MRALVYVCIVAISALIAGLCLAHPIELAMRDQPEDETYLSYTIPVEAVERELAVKPVPSLGKLLGYWMGNEFVGERRFFRDQITLYQETLYRDGQKHGLQRKWYENGNLRYKIPYKNGVIHGICKHYNAKGKLIDESTMEQGTGVMRFWREGGEQLESQCAYRANRKNGMCREWFPNGRICSEVPYVDGKREGRVRFYYLSGGAVQDMHYRAGKKHGILRLWDQQGKLEKPVGFWMDGKEITKTEYLKACEDDSSLPRYDPADD